MRRALFTPFKVSSGPDRGVRMKRYRVTTGSYTDTGERFKITDDWLRPSNAHRLLRCGWVGTTEFQEIPEYMEESLDQGSVEQGGICGGDH